MFNKCCQKLLTKQSGRLVPITPSTRLPANGIGRTDFIKAIITKTFSGMCGVLSLPLTVASPFIPTPEGGKVAVLLLGVTCFLQATYSAWEIERTRAMNLQTEVARQGRLKIEFNPRQRRFNEVQQGLYRNLRRTLSVRIRNAGGTTVSDCKLYVVSVEPNEGGLADDIRMPTFAPVSLNPEHSVYVPLVTYGEPGTSVNGDTMDMLHVPFTANFRLEHERTIGTDIDYVIRLRATGSGSNACICSFRIWIRNHHLHMEALKT